MKSRTTKRFWELYYALPREIQERADKAYILWLDSPNHPGIHSNAWTIKSRSIRRASAANAALGVLRGETITWYWIGKHEIYDRLLD